MLGSVFLVCDLLERNRLVGERSKPCGLLRAVFHVLSNELAFDSQVKDSAVLVEDNLGLLPATSDKPCRRERCPPEDSV